MAYRLKSDSAIQEVQRGPWTPAPAAGSQPFSGRLCPCLAAVPRYTPPSAALKSSKGDIGWLLDLSFQQRL